MSTAIKIENLSKQYRLGVINTGTLSHDLNRWWTVNILHKDDPYLKIGDTNDRATRGSSEYVWALKDINMEIEQGDVVGIIGKNGAGKSTLLKILSRVTKPTTGTISYKGRIASLLEVGTGFHPEMTGRENIYMNGAIMGMSRAEVSRKLDEIVDFAGVERYLDTPVKRYSSGMTVRLGFAIAAHLEPEILVVDEVLAVGDAEFQKKAIGKMQDVSHSEGRTVLFVSHNMTSIKKLCKRGIVLKNGMIELDSDVNTSVDYYVGTRYASSNNIYYKDINTAPGNDNIRIRSFSVMPSIGNEININSGIDVELVFLNNKENAILDATFELRTVDDIIVFHQGAIISPNKDSKKGEYKVTMHIPPYLLNAGRYVMKVWFGENCRYLLWGSLEHSFEVNQIFSEDGFVLGNRPGVLHTNLEFKSDLIS